MVAILYNGSWEKKLRKMYYQKLLILLFYADKTGAEPET
jgi:hypothetical protein